jgi:hypothetical protein
MLAGMLLHVIESAGPVQPSPDRAFGQWCSQEVRYAVPFVDHIDDLDAAQLPGIMQLAA